jgi:hypothetical protein
LNTTYKWVPGVADPTTSGIRYRVSAATNGSLQVALVNLSPTENVTITYLYPVSPSTYTATAVSSDSIKGSVNVDGYGEDTFKLTTTPLNGYMLDYWEVMEGSGTYADGIPYAVGTKIHNDPLNTLVNIQVRTGANSEFKAYFRPFEAILFDTDARIRPDHESSANRILGFGVRPAESTVVREGTAVVLNFEFTTTNRPPTNEYATIKVDIYKGNSISGDRFFSNYYSNNSLGIPGQVYSLDAHVGSVPFMDGFTVVATMNNSASVSRYYDVSGYIISDALATARENAITTLNAVLAACKSNAGYASVGYLIENVFETATTAIVAAESADDIARLQNTAMFAMMGFINNTGGVEDIVVAISVEKLTVDGTFIIEPTLFTAPKDSSAAYALTELLKLINPDVQDPYRITGAVNTSAFYLQGVYDPSYTGLGQGYAGYLSQFDEGGGSGWMLSVNNSFPNAGGGGVVLHDGDVVRWQYTKSTGSDLGAGEVAGGDSGVSRANKDALILKVAQINKAGNASTYGDAYAYAMETLRTLAATQSSIDLALAALNGGVTGDPTIQVTLLIAALPGSSEIALSDSESVRLARVAYDLLDEGRKANVLNYALLVQAEAKLAELSAATDKVALLQAPVQIDAKTGTEFELTMLVNAWPAEGAKAVQAIVNMPDGVEIEGVQAASELSGGTVNFNLSDGKLRIAYLSMDDGGNLAYNATGSPSGLFIVTLKTTEGGEGTYDFSAGGLSVIADSSGSAVAYDVTGADVSVTSVKTDDGIAVTARTLYTGDGSDLIPNGRKAVAVDAVGLDEALQLTFSGTELLYSPELSKGSNRTYVAMFAADVDETALNDAAGYEVGTTSAASLKFGDVNDDEAVNAQDALGTLNAWLRVDEQPGDSGILKMNVTADSRIDTVDVLAIVENYVSGSEFAVLGK